MIFGISSVLHTRSMEECLCVGSMGGRELAVMMTLALWLGTLGEGAQVLAAEVAVAAATCCANSHRLFGISQHSCSFEYLLTPRQQAKRTYIKNVPQTYCAWPVTHSSAYLPRRSGKISIKKKMANATRRNFLTKLPTDTTVLIFRA